MGVVLPGDGINLSASRNFSELRLSADEFPGIEKICKELGAELVNLGELSPEKLREFYFANRGKELLKPILRQAAKDPSLLDCISASEARYEIEYGTWQSSAFQALVSKYCQDKPSVLDWAQASFYDLPNYAFTSPILEAQTARLLIDPQVLKKGMVVDVGSGNGQLLRFLVQEFGIAASQCMGIDIAPSAMSLIQAIGAKGVTGTLPLVRLLGDQNGLAPESSGTLFLSYFVDRDNNQCATFEQASRVLLPGGQIILEGLLPVKMQDSLGTDYSEGGGPPITPGISAAGDIEAISNFFSARACKLTKVVLGERLVYSLDGFERLPSIFMVFRKEQQ